MFVARMNCTTVKSGVTFEVFDVMTGGVLLVTRDPGKAALIAVRCNSGDKRLSASDFGGSR